MKILSTKDQLLKRREQLRAICIFQQYEIETVETEKRKLEDKLFKNLKGIDLLSFKIVELRKVLEALYEYTDSIDNEYKSILTNEAENKL